MISDKDLKRSAFFIFSVVLVASVAHTQIQSGGYALDDVPRDVSPFGELVCPEVPLIKYQGTLIRYSRPARVHPAFAGQLKQFEEVVAQTAVSVFGREPQFIVQKGSYNCRRVRSIPSLISEHSLGNALDVYGFKFGPLKKGQILPEGLPGQFKRGFSVSLLKHWRATSTPGMYYSQFLRQLAENLVDRPDIFNVMLGPAYPGHKNHFHFDCANYSLVSI
ncbi:MAG: extensin family protein [Deltaproteobacteria bacterium]|nr:extensin family protein [Deltaproteobacteria bacterium]